MRNQHGGSVQRESKEKIENICQREISIAQQADFYHWIRVTPLPDNGEEQRHDSDCKKAHDEVAFEPVFGLAAVQNYFQARESHRHGKNSPTVYLQLAILARRFDFALEFRRIGKQTAGEDQRDDADRDVDEENPAPAPVVRNPAAEWRTDRRRRDDSHAVERESRRAFGGRESIHEDSLLDWSQPSAADSLQDSKKYQRAQAWRKTAE